MKGGGFVLGSGDRSHNQPDRPDIHAIPERRKTMFRWRIKTRGTFPDGAGNFGSGFFSKELELPFVPQKGLQLDGLILSAEVDPSTVEDIIYDIKKGIFIVFIEDQRYGSETEYQKWKEIYFESWWTLDCESLPDRALTPPLFT
jgi:hypothetical protein